MNIYIYLSSFIKQANAIIQLILTITGTVLLVVTCLFVVTYNALLTSYY